MIKRLPIKLPLFRKKMKSKSKSILILIITFFILLLISAYVINSYGLLESRIMRVLSTLVFFIFFVSYKGYKEVWVFIAFLSFLISNFLMLFYEVPFCNKLTSILAIFGYFSLIYHVYKTMKIHITNTNLFIFYAFIVLLNFYGLYQIMSNIDAKLDDYLQKFIMYLYGSTIIIVCLFATNYKKGIKKSMYFLFFVYAFSFSDFCAVLGYYYQYSALYYFSRAAYLFALFFMVRYILTMPDDNNNLLNNESYDSLNLH